MRNSVNKLLKNFVARLGLEATRSEYSFRSRRNTLIRVLEIDLVIDVGANEGQWASDVRSGNSDIPIVSFEPLTKAFSSLASAKGRDDKWSLVQAAAGAETGTLGIHVAANSVSSSFLPMLELHRNEAPGSETRSIEQVRVTTVDTEIGSAGTRIYLKADTQGYEFEVLKGSVKTLNRACAVELELSLVPLYAGSPSIWDAIRSMEIAGFTLCLLEPSFTATTHPQTLQLDAVFVRTSEMLSKHWPLPTPA